jgi:hypothetical protein
MILIKMCRFFKKKPKFSLPFIAFLEASGLAFYCGLIGLLMWQGEKIFGPIYTFLGPTMFLILFVASALISALLILGYPFLLFWEEKKTKEALRLVGYSIAWLAFYIFLIFLILLIL